MGTCEQLVKNSPNPTSNIIPSASSGVILRVDEGRGVQISVPHATWLRIKETSGFAGDRTDFGSVVPHANFPFFPTQRSKNRYFTPRTSLTK